MAGQGRKSAPIPIKILKGKSATRDVAGRPIPTAPPFARGAPTPPAWLSTVARELWDKIAPGLEQLDLLKPEDLTTFTSYCETWATYVEALQTVRCEGLTVTNSNTGMPHKNPAVGVLEQAGVQMLRYAVEFGLTPAAEVALARPAADDDGEDPFAS